MSVALHDHAEPDSCFKYQANGCLFTAYDLNPSFAIQPTVTDSDVKYYLQHPTTMAIHLQGTGKGTVTSSPAGISCPGTCSSDFPAGSQVSLTETPASGDVFGGWGQLCAASGLGSPTCSFTMPSTDGSTLNISPTFITPTPPPPTPTPTPSPKASTAATPTPRPSAKPTATPTVTLRPGSTATPAPTKGSTSGGPTSAPDASGPVATEAGATEPPTQAPDATTTGPVAVANPSLAPLDTAAPDVGQPASSGSAQPLVVGGLIVLLVVLGGGALFFFRKPRGIAPGP